MILEDTMSGMKVVSSNFGCDENVKKSLGAWIWDKHNVGQQNVLLFLVLKVQVGVVVASTCW